MRQGEIRPLLGTDVPVRFLIVSNDSFNLGQSALGAPIYRLPDDPPIRVGLHDSDPMAGAVDLRWLGPLRPEDLGEPVGTIGGHTMGRVRAAVAAIVEDL